MRSDAQLIRGVSRGSREAAGQLFDRHWQAAWRAAYSVTASRTAADDIAQDAFQQVLTAARRFDPSRSFEPWLRRIVVNKAVDWLRRERRFVEYLPEHESAARAHLGADGSVALTGALAELREDQRLVLVLHHVLDFQIGEIAEMLEIPTGTVASRLQRARAKLKTRLEEPDESRSSVRFHTR